MSIRSTLFACAIAAAVLGACRDDRNRELGYSYPLESSYNTGGEATDRGESAGTPQSMPGTTDATPPRAGAGPASPDRQARPDLEPRRSPGPTPGFGSRAMEPNGLDIDDDADTSSIPTPGGTDGLQSTNGGSVPVAPEPPPAPTSTPGAPEPPPVPESTAPGSPEPPAVPDTNVPVAPAPPAPDVDRPDDATNPEATPAPTQDPTSPFNETSSGQGTTEGTGVNTENAGTR